MGKIDPEPEPKHPLDTPHTTKRIQVWMLLSALYAVLGAGLAAIWIYGAITVGNRSGEVNPPSFSQILSEEPGVTECYSAWLTLFFTVTLIRITALIEEDNIDLEADDNTQRRARRQHAHDVLVAIHITFTLLMFVGLVMILVFPYDLGADNSIHYAFAAVAFVSLILARIFLFAKRLISGSPIHSQFWFRTINFLLIVAQIALLVCLITIDHLTGWFEFAIVITAYIGFAFTLYDRHGDAINVSFIPRARPSAEHTKGPMQPNEISIKGDMTFPLSHTFTASDSSNRQYLL